MGLLLADGMTNTQASYPDGSIVNLHGRREEKGLRMWDRDLSHAYSGCAPAISSPLPTGTDIGPRIYAVHGYAGARRHLWSSTLPIGWYRSFVRGSTTLRSLPSAHTTDCGMALMRSMYVTMYQSGLLVSGLLTNPTPTYGVMKTVGQTTFRAWRQRPIAR